MDNVLSSNRVNELEIYLGLREKTPIELFYENPRWWTLRKIPKHIQTTEMVELAVSNDGTALQYVSKMLITKKLCKIAVIQNIAALQYIPSKLLTRELCELALENFKKGLDIRYIPKEYITDDLCRTAVTQDIAALQYIPSKFLTRELCELALENFKKGLDIRYIPKEYITDDLCRTAVTQDIAALQYIPSKFLTSELCELALENFKKGLDIRYIPQKYITTSLALKAVSFSIKDNLYEYPIFFIPDNIITENLVFVSVRNSPLSLKNIPDRFITQKLCDLAVSLDSDALKYVPEHMRTKEICLTVIKDTGSLSCFFDLFPNDLRNDKVILDELIQKFGADIIIRWNEWSLKEKYTTATPLLESTVKYLQSKVIKKAILQPQENPIFKLQAVKSETPPLFSESSLIKRDDEDLCIYDFAKTEDSDIRTIYYVSDLHLEHHILHHMENQSKQSAEEGNVNLENINSFLDIKLSELVQNSNRKATLLIGGDVAYSIELTKLFYDKLSRVWRGPIIFILGNHELWDGHPEGKQNYVSRPIDDIVNNYREQLTYRKEKHIIWGGPVLLQNALYIIYKNCQKCIIEEMEILNASDEDLRDLCSKTSLILLGGIGFSGLNPHYNADLGLYRSSVTTLEEDKKLTQRFCSVYDKLNRCAGDMQVIVFTHNPVHDWTSEPCNPNWIYVNGHTHQNTFIKEKDGTTILSDNQIGYEPKKWTLKGFNVFGWYDPFRNLKDGIHKITSEMYKDFNLGRGIQSNGANYPGQIYALKRNGLYMFLLESASGLCLLVGGKRQKLEYYTLNYYYENMDTYSNIIIEAFSPYHKFLENLAEEIRHFGGWGTVHGCIVDISFFSHIYVNPYDGKMTPYFAYDISSRLTYEDLSSLLKDKEPELTQKFLNAHEQGLTPTLSEYYLTTKNNKTNNKIVPTAPGFDSSTEMYAPSRIMRSIQYIFDHNVIRNWNDELLTKNFNKNLSIAEFEEK